MSTRGADAWINVKTRMQAAAAGIRRVEAMLGGLGRSLASTAKWGGAAAGGLFTAGGAMAALSVRTLAAANELNRLAAASGESVTEIDAMGAAVQRAGGESEDYNDALLELQQRAVNNAADFKRWGIQVKDTQGNLLTGSQIMANVADRLKGIESQTKRVALADELMSDAGRRMLPFLAQGSEAMKKQADEARELGLTIDGFEARSAAVLSKRFETLGRQGTNLQRVFGSILAPAVAAISDGLIKVGGATIGWLRANRQLLQQGIISVLEWIGDTALPGIAAGVGAVAKVWTGWQQLVTMLKWTIAEFSRDANDAFASMLLATSEALDAIGADGLAGSLREAGMASASVAASFQRDMADYGNEILAADQRQKDLEATLGDLGLKGALVMRELANGTKAYVLELGKADEAAGNLGKGKAPEDEKKDGPIRRRTGNLLASYFQTQRTALDAQLSDIEAADKAMQEQSRKSAEAFVTNWQWAATSIQAVAATMGQALAAAITGGGDVKKLIGDNLVALGTQLVQMGVAALAMTALSAIPVFAPLVGPPGMSAAAGAIATAAGLGIIGIGKAMGGGGVAGGEGGARGGGRSSDAARPRVGVGAPTAGGTPSLGSAPAIATTVVNVHYNSPQGNPRRTYREIQRLAGAT